MKKIIRLTEQDLKSIISESVKRILVENTDMEKVFMASAEKALTTGDKKDFFNIIISNLEKNPNKLNNNYGFYKPGENEVECEIGDAFALVKFDIEPNASNNYERGDYLHPDDEWIEDDPYVHNIEVFYYVDGDNERIIEDDGTLREYFENDARGNIDYSDYDKWINDEPDYED